MFLYRCWKSYITCPHVHWGLQVKESTPAANTQSSSTRSGLWGLFSEEQNKQTSMEYSQYIIQCTENPTQHRQERECFPSSPYCPGPLLRAIACNSWTFTQNVTIFRSTETSYQWLQGHLLSIRWYNGLSEVCGYLSPTIDRDLAVRLV